MKKLEKLLEKIVWFFQELKCGDGTLGFVVFVILLLVSGVWTAVTLHFYLLLTLAIGIIVAIITGDYIKKIFFEKLDNYLLETPRSTKLIGFIIFTMIVILSCKYFISIIFATIFAFFVADYFKNEEKQEKDNNQ